MQNNIENNDHFSRQVRQKLENHATPVDPALWGAIEAKMVAGKAKRRIAPVWWLTAGMAAAVALILTLSPFNVQTHTEQAQLNSDKSAVGYGRVAGSEKKIASAETEQRTEKKLTPAQPAVLPPAAASFEKEVPATVEVVPATEPEKPAVAAVAQEAYTAQIATQPDDTVQNVGKPTQAPKLQLKQEEWKDPLEEKNNSKWELIALVGGTGKSSQSANPVMGASLLRTPRMGIADVETVSTYLFAPEEFSEKTYMAPVTAGLIVSHRITEKLAVETGLNYSYLLTSFKGNQVTANLNLHYMGVPLRFTYRLSPGGSKWNMYAGVGATLEKGLWSVYVQTQNYTNQTINTTVSDKINGVQWSVNTAFGGEYTLTKTMAVYFEPKLSYYFENNQPVSIRSANKLVVGLEGGLRYKF